jgi:hypothetical protein
MGCAKNRLAVGSAGIDSGEVGTRKYHIINQRRGNTMTAKQLLKYIADSLDTTYDDEWPDDPILTLEECLPGMNANECEKELSECLDCWKKFIRGGYKNHRIVEVSNG